MSENPVLGMPIWAYYINIDDQSHILSPRLFKGLYGQHYAIEREEMPGFNFVRSEGELEGTYGDNARTVRLFYRKALWAELEEVHMYLLLKADTPIYDMVEGFLTPTTLPAGMTVRAFKRVATTNGRFWYEISPNQWVLYQNMEITTNPFQYTDHTPIDKQPLEFEPIDHQSATIDYIPGERVQVYTRPYGTITNELKHGTSVTVIGKGVGDDGVTWYKIEGDEYINGTYLKLQ